MRALFALLLGACTPPVTCPPADLAPLDREPAYAYVTSDYDSSAVGLLDRDAAVITEAWIDSGTVTPRIVAALSEDVVLGSRALAPCVLSVIDRFTTDVLTFLDTCAADPILGQLDVGASFRSNPQDVIALDDHRALVSRHTPNLLPGAIALELGNDLLEIDWRAQRILSRIDLSPLDADVAGERIYARPQRMARVSSDGTEAIVVGLVRLSFDFHVAGPGAVAIVDPITFEARALELDGFANCGEVDAVPDRPDLALVTCQGSSFVDEEDRRAAAGLALLEMRSDGTVAVLARWRAADHPESPVLDSSCVPISADRAVCTAMGDLQLGIPDRVATISFDGAAPELLFEADTAFVIGDGAFDAASGLLLVPDADTGMIRRFENGTEREPIDPSGCRRLPPREVRPL